MLLKQQKLKNVDLACEKGSMTMMKQVYTDPRVLRTRKLIMDSFIALSNKKDFNDISVKDITEDAMINRATFYNHFLDKYDLLEQVVSEKLSLNLNCSSKEQEMTLEETFKQIFFSLVKFEQSIERHRERQQETETIDSIVQLELNNIFQEALTSQELITDPLLSFKLASLLTHTVTGLSSDYNRFHKKEQPEEYIRPLLPYILNGIAQKKSRTLL